MGYRLRDPAFSFDLGKVANPLDQPVDDAGRASGAAGNFMGAFGVGLLLWWLVGIPASLITSSAGDFFQFLLMNGHVNALIDGKIGISDISYFLTLIALGLFVGTTAVEMRRWR